MIPGPGAFGRDAGTAQLIDGRTRVTVIGARKRVDVALPMAAPIGEYSVRLASMCGQASHGALPSAWSLAVAGGAPLPLSASLEESGILDGQVVYLRDLARDPGVNWTVEDLPELIATEAQNQRPGGWPPALVVMTLGLAWLAVCAGFAFFRPGGGLLTAAVTLIVAGLLLLAAGWGLAQRGTLVPPALCVLTSLTAVPCLAAAGALLGQTAAGGPFLWIGAIVGASAGVLMSLAATPEAVVLLVGLQFAVPLLLAPLLAALHATGVQVAAATVVAMLSMLGLTKRAAALATVWSQRRPPNDTPMTNVATVLLIRTRRLLAVLLAGPILALAVALVVLAFSSNWFAFAMAVTAAVALVTRAQQAGFAEERIPVGVAGLVGLFAVLAATAERAERTWHLAGASTALLAIAGFALVAGGATVAMLGTADEPAQDMPPGFPADAGRPDRRKLAGIFGVLCTIAAVSLALGVFGVFGDLMTAGRGIVR
jgi:hypothetical protein